MGKITVPGTLMAAEMAECPRVFSDAVLQHVEELDRPKAIYTIARGSNDTVARVLSYTFMSRLGIPMTSLPPTVFGLAGGVGMQDAMGLLISGTGSGHDTVSSAKGIRAKGGRVGALVNIHKSPVETHCDFVVPIGAGLEEATPSTKTVVGALGAGMALLAAMDRSYHAACAGAGAAFETPPPPPEFTQDIVTAINEAEHLYIIGRRASYGAAQEIALKLKEACTLHAEAHSAAEVLHGPIEVSTAPLTVLILDAGDIPSKDSLDAAEARFRRYSDRVYRVSPSSLGWPQLSGPAAVAALLTSLYPVVHATALHRGLNPDVPQSLLRVTNSA